MNCAGPGCTFPLDPNGPSEFFHTDTCQASYDAQAVDRVWPTTGQQISEEIQVSLDRSLQEEGPTALTHINEHLKVSD